MSVSLEHKLDQMREGVWRPGLIVAPVRGGKRFSVTVEQLCLFNLTKNDCLHEPISSLKPFFVFLLGKTESKVPWCAVHFAARSCLGRASPGATRCLHRH